MLSGWWWIWSSYFPSVHYKGCCGVVLGGWWQMWHLISMWGLNIPDVKSFLDLSNQLYGVTIPWRILLQNRISGSSVNPVTFELMSWDFCLPVNKCQRFFIKCIAAGVFLLFKIEISEPLNKILFAFTVKSSSQASLQRYINLLNNAIRSTDMYKTRTKWSLVFHEQHFYA